MSEAASTGTEAELLSIRTSREAVTADLGASRTKRLDAGATDARRANMLDKNDQASLRNTTKSAAEVEGGTLADTRKAPEKSKAEAKKTWSMGQWHR